MATLNLCRYNFEYFPVDHLEESIDEIKQEVEQKTVSLSERQEYIEEVYDVIQKEKQQELDSQVLQEKKNQEQLEERELIGSVDNIPVFEIGSVQLVEVHEKLGVTQEDIDWINDYKKSIAFFPDRNSENKILGFRLLNTGRIQFGIN